MRFWGILASARRGHLPPPRGTSEVDGLVRAAWELSETGHPLHLLCYLYLAGQCAFMHATLDQWNSEHSRVPNDSGPVSFHCLSSGASRPELFAQKSIFSAFSLAIAELAVARSKTFAFFGCGWWLPIMRDRLLPTM